ncbi:hypothetical protein FO519_005710 [Halicephalobus sp. NKZ332]|nr:hypothetical protein FO519_005710 [Halicephalobus sp. NKZ332]
MDEENPEGTRNPSLSFTLERPVPEESKKHEIPPLKLLHNEEIKHLINLAVNLHKNGISPLEISLAKLGGVPDEFKEDMINLHDRLNTIMGAIEVIYDPKGRLVPEVVSLKEKNINELKKLLGAGESFQNFIKKMRQYHWSPRCNVVWRQNTVAYRCQTCGLNSCMSLCAECFEKADHEGHDYSRFFSTVGGCCDCGNSDVMDPKGFCRFHREGALRESEQPPQEDLVMLRYVLVKLLTRTLVVLRRWVKYYRSFVEYTKNDIREPLSCIISTNAAIEQGILPIVNFLTELSEGGSVITDILIELLLDKDLYKAMCSGSSESSIFESRTIEAPDWRLMPNLEEDLNSLKKLTCIRSMPDKSKLHELSIDCILDELIIYLIRIAYPQGLIDLLLNLLYDMKYKERFAKKFFSYYPYTTAMVADLLKEIPPESHEGSKIAERIVHISVQICSGANICTWLQNEIDVVNCILEGTSMMAVLGSRPTDLNHTAQRFHSSNPPDEFNSENPWLTANVENNQFFSKNADLFVLTDTQNLTVHESIAKALFLRRPMVEKYIRNVEFFHGMGVEWRIVRGDHRVNDWASRAQKCYNVEFEACSLPMHNLFQHVSRREECEIFYDCIMKAIQRWFESIRIECSPTLMETPPYAVTFHIPLLRHLACLVFQMQCIGDECDDIIGSLRSNEQFLRLILLYPMRIPSARSEFYAGMWARNGQSIRTAVSHYSKPTITFSFQSADLLLIRFAASNIDQEFFWNCVLSSFHLHDCFNYLDDFEEVETTDPLIAVTRRAWIPFLVDGALRLVIDLIIGRRDTEKDSNELLKEEMVALLARQDLPYSHVRAVIPTRGNIAFDQQVTVFDKLIEEVANFVEPDQNNSLQYGRYELKEELYETKVCPAFCRLRSFGMVDFNEFMKRMDSRDKAKCGPSLPATCSAWLPYRMYDFDKLYEKKFKSVRGVAALLTQPTFFLLCQRILLKVNRPNYYYTSIVFQETIYLLTLSVQFLKSKIFNECEHLLFRSRSFPVNSTDHMPFYQDTVYMESIKDSGDPRRMVMNMFMRKFNDEDSILTLLLELFTKLILQQKPELQETEALLQLSNFLNFPEKGDERIYGSGAEYIGRLLRNLFSLDDDIGKEIRLFLNQTKSQAEVPMEVDAQNSASESSGTDKKAKLKKKKDAFLQKLQKKGAALMKIHMESEGISQSEMDRIETKSMDRTMYVCPFCSDTTDHSLANPVGIFVLTRPNNVVSNSVDGRDVVMDLMDLAPSPRTSASASGFTRIEPEQKERKKIRTLKTWSNERDGLCLEAFNEDGKSALKSIRYRTGIEVRSCGHFAHLTCFKSYLDSLTSSPTIRVDFTLSCPMCRTSINTILPLKVEYGREKLRADFDIEEIEANLKEITDFYMKKLLNPRPIFEDNVEMKNLQKEYREVYESFEDIAYRQLLNGHIDHGAGERGLAEGLFKGFDARMGFVQSNIERMVMCVSLDLPSQSFSKNSMIEHILSGAVTLSLRKDQTPIEKYWQGFMNAATGQIQKIEEVKPYPPMLLCDFQSLYLKCTAVPLIDEQFVDSDRKSYCKVLYHIFVNLCFTKAIQVLVSKCSNRNLLNQFLESGKFGNGSIVERGLQNVLEASRALLLESSTLFYNEQRCENPVNFISESELIEYTKNQAEQLLIYLTKFVVVLLKNVFKEELSEEEKQVFMNSSFEQLFTTVFGGSDDRQVLSLGISSRFFLTHLIQVIKMETSQPLLDILLKENFNWKYRSILKLPPLYDKLFATFFGQKCSYCGKEPRHQILCLLCGTFMCLHKCNPRDEIVDESETLIEKHTLSCGAGSCCYLSLNSTMIIMNYCRQALLWGTLYLDAHGEEDRNLFRGKPLYLSENRISQLLKSWYVQDLDRKGQLRWFSIDQLAAFLKQCHHAI